MLIYLLFVLCWIHQLIWLIQFTYFVIILLNLSSFSINFIALQFKHCCQSALILYYLLIDFILIYLFSWSLCYKLRFNLFLASSKTLSFFSTVVLIENHFSFGLFNIVMICHSITFVIEKYYLCCYDLWAMLLFWLNFCWWNYLVVFIVSSLVFHGSSTVRLGEPKQLPKLKLTATLSKVLVNYPTVGWNFTNNWLTLFTQKLDCSYVDPTLKNAVLSIRHIGL